MFVKLNAEVKTKSENSKRTPTVYSVPTMFASVAKNKACRGIDQQQVPI